MADPAALTSRYVTALELAAAIGGITPATVRTMRTKGLPYFKPGKAYLYPLDKALHWIEAQEKSECHAPTPGQGSSESPAERTSTSSGTKAENNSVAALARQTAERLKRTLPPSSANENCVSALPVRLTRRAT